MENATRETNPKGTRSQRDGVGIGKSVGVESVGVETAVIRECLSLAKTSTQTRTTKMATDEPPGYGPPPAYAPSAPTKQSMTTSTGLCVGTGKRDVGTTTSTHGVQVHVPTTTSSYGAIQEPPIKVPPPAQPKPSGKFECRVCTCDADPCDCCYCLFFWVVQWSGPCFGCDWGESECSCMATPIPCVPSAHCK